MNTLISFIKATVKFVAKLALALVALSVVAVIAYYSYQNYQEKRGHVCEMDATWVGDMTLWPSSDQENGGTCAKRMRRDSPPRNACFEMIKKTGTRVRNGCNSAPQCATHFVSSCTRVPVFLIISKQVFRGGESRRIHFAHVSPFS